MAGVIDKDSGLLLGATFIGRETSAVLHASTVAIVGKFPVGMMFRAVLSFQVLSQIYAALLEASGY